jgi:hypothetical protein
MKLETTVYSFKNRKPVFYKLQRFYKVKNEKKLDKLINELLDLDIDAVASPCPEDLIFPCVLEMQSGFSLSLKQVDKTLLKKEVKKLKELF